MAPMRGDVEILLERIDRARPASDAQPTPGRPAPAAAAHGEGHGAAAPAAAPEGAHH
jgi:NADH-quinone oxidoreductase subunit M